MEKYYTISDILNKVYSGNTLNIEYKTESDIFNSVFDESKN